MQKDKLKQFQRQLIDSTFGRILNNDKKQRRFNLKLYYKDENAK